MVQDGNAGILLVGASLVTIREDYYAELGIHVDLCRSGKGKQLYIANGERLEAETYQEALNAVGKERWELVAVMPPALFSSSTHTFAQFCLKRPTSE
jgi:hypothetical protein